MDAMKKYILNGIKPSYPYYRFLILNTDKYKQEILDIFTDAIGEAEIEEYNNKIIIFYFNKLDIDFKSLVKTINDDFYTDAHLFESGKMCFEKDDFKKIFDIYLEAKLDNLVYSSNWNIVRYLITNNTSLLKEVAPILLNKMIKDESLLLLANTMFECDLNVSKTSQNIYMHRNTVNYKLEQIKEETSLDIRKFKDAIVMFEFLKLL